MTYWEVLALACGWIVALFVFGLGARVIYLIWTNKIDLSFLLSDGTDKASLARFQLLIFTFVIALSLYLVTVKTSAFPAIPNEILGLLGISGGSFVLSKGIDARRSPQQLREEAIIRNGAVARREQTEDGGR
jgi:hypothetical protein